MMLCYTFVYVMLCYGMLWYVCYGVVYDVMVCYVMICDGMLWYDMSYCGVLCYVRIWYVILCSFMLCCVVI